MTALWSTLVNGAILSALFSLTVWLILRMTPRGALNAATRYAIWWLVLLVTVAPPLIYVGLQVTKPAHATMPKTSGGNPVTSLRWQPLTPAARNISRSTILPIEIPASPWLRPILAVWMISALLLLARVFVSYAALYRRSARATDAPLDLHPRGSQRGRLAISDEVAIPIATGPFRPAILIPARLFDQLSAADLDRIVLHESAHLNRRDDYALFAQRMIEALFALHPVVRAITRQIELEREVACDDMVVTVTENAGAYADCLTRLVVLCGGVRSSLAAAGVADNRSQLSRRIELLVARSRTTHARLPGNRFAVIAIGLLGAAALLEKTPLLVAFAVPRTAIPHTIEGYDAPAPKTPDLPVIPRAAGPVLMAQSPIVVQRQTELGKSANEQMQAREFDAAIATYQTLLSEVSNPTDQGDIWARLGEAYRYKSDFANSIQALEKAVALLPNSAPIMTNLALLYDAQGDSALARQYYEKVLAITPNNPLVLNNLAYLLTETNGDLDLALTYARTAKEKLPNFLEVSDTLGWIYLKKNMTAEAINEFKTLTALVPNNPIYHYHYAMALNQQGNQADADNECQVALANGPKPPLREQIRQECVGRLPQIDTRPPVSPGR